MACLIPPLAGRVNSPPLAAFTVQIPSDTPLLAAESFIVVLGQVSALNLAFDQSYWLEVGVGAETMPRIRFTSVGYAYRAMVADSAAGGGGWVDDGDVVRLQTSTDYVGIGTSSPWSGLHLKGTGFPSAFMYIQSDSGQDAGLRFYEGANVKWHIFNNTSVNGLRIYNSNGSKTVFFAQQSTGYVGLGTTSPNSNLQVNGSVAAAYNYVTASSYTATSSDCIIAVNASSDHVDITLPSAVGITGRIYTIKMVAGSYWVTVFTTSGQTIDGHASSEIEFVLWQYVTVISDGANWLIIGKNF